MLPDWASYRTHAEILGGSQYGKTSFAVYCRRRHILAGNRVISLDYKSGGYENDVAFIAHACPDYPSVFLNVSNPDVIQCYSPFSLPPGRDLAVHVNHLAEVVLKVVSNQPIADLQNFARVAEAFFAHAAVSQIPVANLVAMLDESERRMWLDGAAQMPDPYFSAEMRRIAATPKNDWKFEVQSLRNRLRPFVTSPALRRISCKPGINIADCIQRGVSIFVNATPSPNLPKESARIFLGLILGDILMAGIENATDSKTVFLYADEAQEYSTDLGSMLDLVAAGGIRCSIIHHYGGQMDQRAQESLAVNAGIKVVFGGLSPKIRRELAEQAYVPEIIQRHHKQERYSTLTEYETDVAISTTERDDGFTSTTTSERLIPHQEQVVTGYDDYSRDEVLDRLAARFVLPKRLYQAILPDQTIQAKVPTLAPYLYNSPTCLDFRKAQPGISPNEADRNNFERSKPRVSTKRKNNARLFDAE